MLSPRCNVIPVASTSSTTSRTIRDAIGKYSSVFSDTLRSMLKWLASAKGDPPLSVTRPLPRYCALTEPSQPVSRCTGVRDKEETSPAPRQPLAFGDQWVGTSHAGT